MPKTDATRRKWWGMILRNLERALDRAGQCERECSDREWEEFDDINFIDQLDALINEVRDKLEEL